MKLLSNFLCLALLVWKPAVAFLVITPRRVLMHPSSSGKGSDSAIRSHSDFRERLKEEKLETSGLKRRSENERFEILKTARKNSRSVAKIFWRNRPLGRRHEVLLFAIYGGAGMTISKLVPANYAQVLLLSTWLSFSLAISFTEAWIKFRAPLLRKHIAVDVGRHVFAALHAVQLGIVSALWCSRRWMTASSSNVSNPYLLAVATTLQLALSFWIGPFLYARAQDKMIHEAGHRHYLTSDETNALKKVAKNIKSLNIPGKKWHVVYVVVETIMIITLGLSLKGIVMAAN